MADADTIRRREIRKRKILEHSEARLNRITNAKRIQDPISTTINESSSTKNVQDTDSNLLPSHEATKSINSNDSDSATESYNFNRSRNVVGDEEDSYNISSNGLAQRSSAADYYIFPKKVSDAESRSFVRSRCDARRNSTCTQMMMETFQFSSFSLAILRPWIAAIVSVILKGYFLFAGNFPFFQTLLLPYLLLEIAFCSWTKFESQINSRQVTSFIPGILLLCGIPVHVVAGFNSALYLVQCAIQDLAVYMFSFVFLHFICETYM